jgi:hypothetical protein
MLICGSMERMSELLALENRDPQLVEALRQRMNDSGLDADKLMALELPQIFEALGPLWKEPVLAPEPEHRPLLHATGNEQDLYLEQARILDFAQALHKEDSLTKGHFVIGLILIKLTGNSVFGNLERIAKDRYHISLKADVMRDYWHLIKTGGSDEELTGFFKKASAEPELRKQLQQASKNYDALRAVGVARGVVRTQAEWQSYMSAWEFLGSMMKGLKQRGVLTDAQFEQRTGYSYASTQEFFDGVSDTIMGGVLAATGWTGKLTGLSDLKAPIAALIFPVTIVMMDGFEGRTFNFQQLSSMFRDSFLLALEGMTAALGELQHTLSSIFR